MSETSSTSAHQHYREATAGLLHVNTSTHLLFILLSIMTLSCTDRPASESTRSSVRLITLDPGHFHAALVQKSMYPNVDSVVHVYAPEGPDVQLHLNRIEGFNTREESPTAWKEVVYTGPDFFERMIEEKPGNVVVLSGNNQKKTEYIMKALEAGLNVLADKPMVIDYKDFQLLTEAFEVARQKNLLLYDIMTERSEITTILQREFSLLKEVFGELEKGTPEQPAVTKESVHHFYKYVSGNILTRPPWFMDVTQQGEGIVDVTTHLVDLIQWECFPDQVLNYMHDISVNSARRWPTDMTLSEFSAITGLDAFPDYLSKNVVNDTILRVYCNGEINYQIRGVHARVSVIWNYKAPEGTGDTHYSIMRGTRANLIIRQGAEQDYKPTLYIEPVGEVPGYEDILNNNLKKVQTTFPGVTLKKVSGGWEVVIPDHYNEGHEAHFARVMERFLDYLERKSMPEWEVPNMIAKYYTTTAALELARRSNVP
jgi:predicted dehydrogenase